MNKVICISGKARHGKDTAAEYFKETLEEAGYSTITMHYADLLKYICKTYFAWDGNKDDYGRSLLQHVGTDVVRRQNPDYWAKFVVDILSLFNDEWDYAIIADCRFPNEVDIYAQNDIPAVHVRVVRPDFDSGLTYDQRTHISETALDNHDYDYLLTNTTLEKLKLDIMSICQEITRKADTIVI